MAHTNWLDIAKKCFDGLQKREMHVDEMAEIAVARNWLAGQNSETIKNKLASALARHVSIGRKASFRKVKNNKGGMRRGVYALKLERPIGPAPQQQYKVTTNYTGKAGEFSVLSELLFRGYNASVMTVDEGLDVVASKDNKYFHIQVKTANGDDTKPYNVVMRKDAFQHSLHNFYIVVLRRHVRGKFINDFLVFPSSYIRQLMSRRVLKDNDNISMRISVTGGTYTLNGEPVIHCLNDFDIIS